jgi:hypothetical protein
MYCLSFYFLSSIFYLLSHPSIFCLALPLGAWRRKQGRPLGLTSRQRFDQPIACPAGCLHVDQINVYVPTWPLSYLTCLLLPLVLLVLVPCCPSPSSSARARTAAAMRLLCGAKKVSWTLPPPAKYVTISAPSLITLPLRALSVYERDYNAHDINRPPTRSPQSPRPSSHPSPFIPSIHILPSPTTSQSSLPSTPKCPRPPPHPSPRRERPRRRRLQLPNGARRLPRRPRHEQRRCHV